MPAGANPPPRSADRIAADQERLDHFAAALADAVEAAVPGWIEGLVTTRVREWNGHVGPEVAAEAEAAGRAARDELMPELRALLRTDIDDQAANPLGLLRAITRHAGAVLDRAGVPEIVRDEFAVRSFPDDVHGLVPATWADIDDDLHELGISWGAAKAYLHKARRREEGRT